LTYATEEFDSSVFNKTRDNGTYLSSNFLNSPLNNISKVNVDAVGYRNRTVNKEYLHHKCNSSLRPIILQEVG